MPRQIKFEGKVHTFPDDVTDDEINEALGGGPRRLDDTPKFDAFIKDRITGPAKEFMADAGSLGSNLDALAVAPVDMVTGMAGMAADVSQGIWDAVTMKSPEQKKANRGAWSKKLQIPAAEGTRESAVYRAAMAPFEEISRSADQLSNTVADASGSQQLGEGVRTALDLGMLGMGAGRPNMTKPGTVARNKATAPTGIENKLGYLKEAPMEQRAAARQTEMADQAAFDQAMAEGVAGEGSYHTAQPKDFRKIQMDIQDQIYSRQMEAERTRLTQEAQDVQMKASQAEAVIQRHQDQLSTDPNPRPISSEPQGPAPRSTLDVGLSRGVAESDGGVRHTDPQTGGVVQGMDKSVPTMDFPLRQEVLQGDTPQAVINQYRLEHAEALARGDQKAARQIEGDFRQYMEMYGVRNPQEAQGLRPLYEGGEQVKFSDGFEQWTPADHRLPIEKTFDARKLGETKAGKSQRGALFDPEFRKFKSELPEPLKPFANKLWKERQRHEVEAERIFEVAEGEHSIKAIADIPGLEKRIENLMPIEKPWAEIKEMVLKDPDLSVGKTTQELYSGGKMVGFASQNKLVRWVTTHVDNALRTSEKYLREHVSNKDAGLTKLWNKLPKDEMGKLWKEIMSVEGIRNLTPDELIGKGYSEKAIKAYEKLHQIRQDVFKKVNETLEAGGYEPIPERAGYIPFRWRGDFVVQVKDANGNVAHYITGTSKGGVKNAIKKMQGQFSDYTFGEVTYDPVSRHGEAQRIHEGYRSLLSMLEKSDPAAAAIEKAYMEAMDNVALDMFGYPRHFRPKAGVGGSMGNKVWENAHTNAKEGMQAFQAYVKQAMEWAELQKANSKIQEAFRDPDIQQSQKRALEYSRTYFDSVTGKSGQLAKSIDQLIDMTGKGLFGRDLNYFLKGERHIKAFWNAIFMGFFNPAFGVSQLIQTVQQVPAWAAYTRQNPVSAVAQAMPTLLKVTTGYLKGLNPDIRKGIEWAKANGAIDSHFLDDVRSLNESRAVDAVRMAASYSITKTEQVARTTAYTVYLHMLKDAGLKGEQLWKTAANMTDLSMVDYRPHERAMMYTHMGTLGEMASALQTFKHNQYSQLVAFGKQGAIGALTSAMAAQAFFGGLMGLYALDEVEAFVSAINATGLTDHPIPSPKEQIMKNASDFLAFGGLSAMSGMDISPKFSAANVLPDTPTQFVWPYLKAIGNLAGDGAQLAKDPGTTQAARLAARNGPAVVKGFAEDYFTDTHGNFVDTKDMAGARYRRTEGEQTMRKFGVRSTDEARQMNKNYYMDKEETFYSDKRESTLKKTNGALMTKDYSRLPELMRKYIEAEGEPQEFIQHVNKTAQAQQIPLSVRRELQSIKKPRKYIREQPYRQ